MVKAIPIEKILNWIIKEKELGSEAADNVVLATASSRGEVHSRIVAIRELTRSGILFFTQNKSRKAKDLNENPSASMTLWLPLQKREVVLDGVVELLAQNENDEFWETLSRERQLRFLSYQSGKQIDSFNTLQADYKRLEQEFENKKIPMNDCYCGYRLVPNRIYFYTLGQDTFSEVVQYDLQEGHWREQLVSP